MSSPAVREFEPLIKKLIETTTASKLKWEQSDGHPRAFLADLPSGRVEVGKTMDSANPIYVCMFKDRQQRVLETRESNPLDPNDPANFCIEPPDAVRSPFPSPCAPCSATSKS
jgi:hypothetical protein